jgi:hydroxyethylthiazole kinase-like uncharacterized protein yjeF
MNGEILTVAEMGQADRLAEEGGVPSLRLMENAGAAVARAVQAHDPNAAVLVLCGPGNNGGDGFAAAALLRERGLEVRVACLVEPAALKGDAAHMAQRWGGPVTGLGSLSFDGMTIIVDALFGAGLARPLEGAVADAVARANASGLPIVAVDVPSGVHGDIGRALEGAGGRTIQAAHTVTFFRKKPAHLVFPGRSLCGETVLADIGIPDKVLETIRPRNFENTSDLWRSKFPHLRREGHKYDRGHAVIVSGPIHATGAARMAARAALRIGAGLVSVASPLDAVAVNAAQLTAIMVKPFDGAKGLIALLADKRLNAVAIGPGCGVSPRTQDLVAAVLASGATAVIDADGLTCFAEDPNALFRQLHPTSVLTPHEGEFARIFPELLKTAASRLEAAREAARIAGCVIVLKGPDTIIARSDGRAAINANAPPWLATAGAGDCLTGMIAGLMGQGMEAFDAACAAVWMHGDAANRFGLGLIAEDIPEMLPASLRAF